MRDLLNYVAGFTIFVGVFLFLVGGSWYWEVGTIIIVMDICIFAGLVVFRNPDFEKSLFRYTLVLAILFTLSLGLVTGSYLATNTNSANSTSISSKGLLGLSSAESSTSSNSITTVTVVSITQTTVSPDGEVITITEVIVYQPLALLITLNNCASDNSTITTLSHTYYEIGENGTIPVIQNSTQHFVVATITTISTSFDYTLPLFIPTETSSSFCSSATTTLPSSTA